MNEFDETIKKLAETYSKNPEGLVNELENLFRIPQEEREHLFLKAGIILYNFSYFKSALAVWDKALEYFIDSKDKRGESACYTNLGTAHCNLGDFKKAAEYYKKASESAIEIGDKKVESACYANLGLVYYSLGDFRKAIEYHERSLEIAIEIGDKKVESACYANLGLAYHNLGDLRKAIEYYERSLEIAVEIGDRQVESKCCTNLGNSYSNLGNFRKAIEYHERSLEIDIEISDRQGESTCYGNLGNAYHSLGDFRKAIEYHERSLEIDIEIGNRYGESTCYGNLGNAYHSLGDFRKAIEYHERSLKIAVEIGNRQGESSCYSNLGLAYHSLGDFRKAIEYHERSLEIDMEIGDRQGESSCYSNLGLAYHSLGDFSKAIEYHERSLEISVEIGDKLGESASYGNLGIAYDILGDLGKAIEYHERSLEIDMEIGDRQGESSCYSNLGLAYHSLGDFKKAIEYHERSLEIAVEIGDRQVESSCYSNLGTAYCSLGFFKKAIEYYKRALEIDRKTNSLDGERITTLNLARIYGDHIENPELAYNYCRKSIELSEKIARELIQEEYKIGFTLRVSYAYKYIVPLCLKLNKEAESFEFVEKGKSRAFLDLLAATEIKPSVKVTPKLQFLLSEEEDYLEKLREVQTRHLRQKKVTVELGEVDNIFEKLNIIYSKIEKFDPEYVFIRKGKPLSLVKLQDVLISQKRDTFLIEYFITKDKVLIFIVSSRDKKLHIETVPILQERLSLYIENYWRSVAEYPDFKDIGSDWLDLSRYLIKPISKYLSEGNLIYFIPYDLLHYLPLHALDLDGEPLIKHHSVAYLPSASLIRFCQNKGSDKLESCASFGVDFEEEAKKVAKLFKVEPYIGSDATKEKVIKSCTGKDIIHFSCHGKFDNLDPLSSGIKLYGDEILTVREVFDLKLDTELVTLSACQTGINDRSPGDELIGLTRAFLYAGTPSVIVSLWSVDAKSTQELMLEFYKLIKSGENKAAALQKAQVKIMNKDKYSHPYYWAPFVLVGDWE